jgi:branched-chain amino acid transport system ATP-binding protein
MAALLEIADLSASYGRVNVLHGIGLTVADGGITALLGANGAGKTSALRAIAGLIRASGTIRFAGEELRGRPPELRARRGIAHVPDGRGTFTGLSTEENLRLGAYPRRDTAALEADMERVYGYFPLLKERRRQQAGTLSGGEQQMLAVGRALMLRPRLLMLDEPSFGVAPRVVEEIFAIIRRVNREGGVGVLLIEQNAALALALADHAVLLETGRVVRSGPARELRDDPTIRHSYLGRTERRH